MKNVAAAGRVKAERPMRAVLLLSVLAGFFIAAGGAAAGLAAFAQESVSAARLASGLIFPFGLGMVLLTGAELFTGNAMMAVSLAAGEIRPSGLLKGWGAVYLGNLAGAAGLAAACAFCGVFRTGDGTLGDYFIRMAEAKCALPFGNAFVSGILCNLLVCTGVLCGLSARDTAGRILGAYIPVALFVICGFEHSVANMFFIPAGMLAGGTFLTIGGFLMNLLPVTLGNLAGGAAVGLALWAGHKQNK